MNKKVNINLLINNNILDNLYKDNELIIKGSDGEKQYNHMIGSSRNSFTNRKISMLGKKKKMRCS
jgi:hypothetical protein